MQPPPPPYTNFNPMYTTPPSYPAFSGIYYAPRSKVIVCYSVNSHRYAI